MKTKKFCPLSTSTTASGFGDCIGDQCGFWVDGSWSVERSPRLDMSGQPKGYRPGGCGISFIGINETMMGDKPISEATP